MSPKSKKCLRRLRNELEREESQDSETSVENVSDTVVNNSVSALPTTDATESESYKKRDLVPGKAVNFVGESRSKFLELKVRIKGKQVNAIIDTGAEMTLISSNIVSELQLTMEKCDVPLRVVGENEMNTIGIIDSEVDIPGIGVSNLKCLVFDGSMNQKISLLLGVDYLKYNKLEINVKDRMVTKHFSDGGQVDIYLDHAGSVIDQMLCGMPCYAASNIDLSQNHIFKVPICYPNVPMHGKLFMYEDSTKTKQLTDKVRGLTGITEANSKFIYMLASEGPVSIKKGQQLGVFHTMLQLDNGEEEEEEENGLANDKWEEKVDLSHLSQDKKLTISKILNCYQDVLSSSDFDIGLASVHKHHIKVTDETPIYQRPRRVPPPIADEIDRQCSELCDADIIEPSTSPWSSPIVPVRKKDGTIRMCIDYRKLNEVTIPDKFPVPNLFDSVFGLHGTEYFTRLDLVKGYYQLPIAESSRPYTAFTTQRNHWQFKRLSFGLKNAPSGFQREIQSVLSGFPSNKVIAYLDDILVMGATFEEHINLVSKVLHTLKTYGIKVKLSKCDWVKTEVEFLGHVVSKSGVRKTPSYVEKALNYPRPKTVGELREFLGFINFQRKFLPNCSVIQKPLSAFTSGNKKRVLDWTPEMDVAFETLRRDIAAEIELAYPDYSEGSNKLEIWVDASDTGAGAYLAQKQNGEHRVIGFASMSFTQTQLNYYTLERELAAIRWGVKTFRPMLLGVEFILYTDHMPLIHLHNLKMVSSRLARTVEELAEYNFEINYVAGHLNSAADALSRLSNDTPLPDVNKCSSHLPDGLVIDGQPAPGGGDSLFVSLFKVLTTSGICRLPDTVDGLRVQLVSDLLDQPAKYQLKLDRDSRRMLKVSMTPGQLPPLEVLFAASRIYDVRILVYFWPEQPIIYQYTHESKKSIYLQCSSGVHFNPLIEVKNYQEPDPRHCPVNSIRQVSQIYCNNRFGTDDVLLDLEFDFDCADVHDEYKSITCGHNLGSQPVVRVSLGLFHTCALLDTGAEISLVSAVTLNAIKNNVEVQRVEETGEICDIVGFSGLRCPIKSVVYLKFNIGSYSMHKCFKFGVVDEGIMPYCFLLGLDFMEEYDLGIDFNSLSCKQKRSVISPLLTGTVVGTTTCVVTTDIPEGTSHIIKPSFVEGSLRFEVKGSSETITGMSLLVEGNVVNQLQSRNTELNELRKLIKGNVPSKDWPGRLTSYRRHANKLSIMNNVVVWGEQRLVVVPHKVVLELAVTIHFNFAHVGRDKLMGMLAGLVWHPSRTQIVHDLCRSCHTCQTMKDYSTPVNSPMIKITSSYPFELVAADLMALPKTSNGNIGCLVVADHYSKFVAAVPIKNKQSSTVIKAFTNHILPFLPAVPTNLLTDNGPEFVSSDFGDFVGEYSIFHKFTSPYHPQSNGACERVNRTIQNLMKVLVEDDNKWDEHLTRTLISYNNSPHSELSMSPSKFLLSKSHSVSTDPPIQNSLQTLWKLGHPKFLPFRVGDFVLCKIQHKGYLNTNKFLAKYGGPYRVVKVNSNGKAYEIIDDSANTTKRAHHDHLRYYNNVPKYIKNCKLYSDFCGDICNESYDSENVQNNLESMLVGSSDVNFYGTGSDSESSVSSDSSSVSSSGDDSSYETSGSDYCDNNIVDNQPAIETVIVKSLGNQFDLKLCLGCVYEHLLEGKLFLSDPLLSDSPKGCSGVMHNGLNDTALAEEVISEDRSSSITSEMFSTQSSLDMEDLYTLVQVDRNALDWDVSLSETEPVSSERHGRPEHVRRTSESYLESEYLPVVDEESSFLGFDGQRSIDIPILLKQARTINECVPKNGCHNRMTTRSSGPVQEYPNVQQGTLEYQAKKS